MPFAGLEAPGEAILTSAAEAGIGLGDLLRDGILSEPLDQGEEGP